MNNGGILKSWPYLLGGAAVGAALAVLFAPQSGRETRADIKRWIKENRKRARHVYAEIHDAIPAKRHQFVAAFKAGREALGFGNHRREPVHS